jgi:glycosyltransferase involved in cell wall biosynthesis
MANPLLSIITVCFNSEQTIEKTIQSVLQQGYSDYEYIIIDGGSSDQTINIIKKYEKNFLGRLKYISEKDNGIYDAMNKGIKMTTGRIIGIINSDDWYENNAFNEIYKHYKEDEAQIIYGFQRLIKNGKEYEVVLKKHEFIKERMINHPTCFIAKKIYEKYGLYDLNYRISADYEFMLRLSTKKDIEYKALNSVIANFSLGGVSSTQDGVLETCEIKRKYNCISYNKYFITKLRAKLYKTYQKVIKK